MKELELNNKVLKEKDPMSATDQIEPSINTQLRENFYTAKYCILLKMHLVIIGKPGTSKSFAINMIKRVLNITTPGDDFKNFKTI